jgi:hypothetical protein
MGKSIYTASELARMESEHDATNVVAFPSSSELDRQESIIADGLRTFVDIGRALAKIRDARLYRERGFETFETYCRQRWEMSKTHANRAITAAAIVSDLTPIGVIPTSESHVRPLLRLPESDRALAWESVVESAPDGKITAKHVADVVRERLGTDSAPEPFHLLIESGRLRESIAKLIERWPVESHGHVPEILRDIADEVEGACSSKE